LPVWKEVSGNLLGGFSLDCTNGENKELFWEVGVGTPGAVVRVVPESNIRQTMVQIRVENIGPEGIALSSCDCTQGWHEALDLCYSRSHGWYLMQPRHGKNSALISLKGRGRRAKLAAELHKQVGVVYKRIP
jgi:hypothetical protein